MNRVLPAMAMMAMFLASTAGAQTLLGKNFSANPSPHYFAGKYYVYATDDQNNSGKAFDATRWRLLVSSDLKDWEDRGPFLAASVFKWADPGASAGAPAALEYKGKYYFFAQVGDAQIGVAVSDRPDGPFIDALGKPLVDTRRDANAGKEPTAPAVIVDAQQRIYLTFGARQSKVAELALDLRGLKGAIRDVSPDGLPARAGSPRHPAVLEKDGKSYLFYHDAVLPGGGKFKRSILMDEIEYGADGAMRRKPGTPAAAGPVWAADLGDGRYRNPVLHADFSDPDAIRVGDMFYMTSSSFSNVPGLPLLQSSDMVNWEQVGNALAAVTPLDVFARPQLGKGVWAPALRHHDGKFWIFYPDPDFGVYVITAEKFAGPWSKPRLLLPGKGIIDPAPLWDDDGKAWIIHGWAHSRSGRNNIVTLRGMAPDASRLLDTQGKDIINGDDYAGYHTLEGPKLHKANGYYYIFAPAGGVENGWQAVFRSRTIGGPYKERVVMARGTTAINGPHQGAWVDGVDGKDWFFHFQDKGPYGRVVHLQPMTWKDGWPVIGEDKDGDGVGEPVATHAKPAGRDRGVLAPPTSDEFSGAKLGLQWQWSANPGPGWATPDARRGVLRLHAQDVPATESLRNVASVLTQKFPAPAFTVDTVLDMSGQDGQRAGLIILGIKYAWIGLRQQGKATQLVYTTCETPVDQCLESVEVLAEVSRKPVHLRVQVGDDGVARFSYSADNNVYVPAGRPFKTTVGRWVGAQIGIFTTAAPGARGQRGHADFDYFRFTR